MKEKNGYWKKYASWFILGIALIVVFKTIDSFGAIFSWISGLIDILMPFFLAALLAFILYTPCKKLESLYKKIKIKFLAKKARPLSVATMYIIVILFIVILVNIIFPALSESVIELAKSLPNYYNMAKEFLINQPEDSLWVRLNIIGIINNLEEINISETILNWLEFDNLTVYLQGIANVAGVIFDIFVTLVVSVYILLERSDIKSFAKNFLKAICSKQGYNKFIKYYRETNSIFYRFITAQIVDAIIVGILTSIAMTVMNVEYATLLGFLIGIMNVIPYFGAIIGVAISVIITIFTGGWIKALWLCLVLIILQQIDANIINPKILGNSLKISRILIIFSVTFFGAYFNVLGMFLGVPIIALIKVFVIDFIDERNKEKIEAENSEELVSTENETNN